MVEFKASWKRFSGFKDPLWLSQKKKEEKKEVVYPPLAGHKRFNEPFINDYVLLFNTFVLCYFYIFQNILRRNHGFFLCYISSCLEENARNKLSYVFLRQ